MEGKKKRASCSALAVCFFQGSLAGGDFLKAFSSFTVSTLSLPSSLFGCIPPLVVAISTRCLECLVPQTVILRLVRPPLVDFPQLHLESFVLTYCLSYVKNPIHLAVPLTLCWTSSHSHHDSCCTSSALCAREWHDRQYPWSPCQHESTALSSNCYEPWPTSASGVHDARPPAVPSLPTTDARSRAARPPRTTHTWRI